jgi:ABC-2 type transport system permease protein
VLMGAGLLVGWRLHNDVFHAAGAFVLVFLFASAMIWVGTWLGLTVRTADAVMGVAFVVIFPLTFISNAFVPIASMPSALQTFAAWNPISVVVAATRHLFGNPVPPVAHTSWPLQHAQFAAFVYVLLILVVFVALSIQRFRARTSD